MTGRSWLFRLFLCPHFGPGRLIQNRGFFCQQDRYGVYNRVAAATGFFFANERFGVADQFRSAGWTGN